MFLSQGWFNTHNSDWLYRTPQHPPAKGPLSHRFLRWQPPADMSPAVITTPMKIFCDSVEEVRTLGLFGRPFRFSNNRAARRSFFQLATPPSGAFVLAPVDDPALFSAGDEMKRISLQPSSRAPAVLFDAGQDQPSAPSSFICGRSRSALLTAIHFNQRWAPWQGTVFPPTSDGSAPVGPGNSRRRREPEVDESRPGNCMQRGCEHDLMWSWVYSAFSSLGSLGERPYGPRTHLECASSCQSRSLETHLIKKISGWSAEVVCANKTIPVGGCIGKEMIFTVAPPGRPSQTMPEERLSLFPISWTDQGFPF